MQLMERLEYLFKKILSKEEDKGVFKPGSTIEIFHIRITLFFIFHDVDKIALKKFLNF